MFMSIPSALVHLFSLMYLNLFVMDNEIILF